MTSCPGVAGWMLSQGRVICVGGWLELCQLQLRKGIVAGKELFSDLLTSTEALCYAQGNLGLSHNVPSSIHGSSYRNWFVNYQLQQHRGSARDCTRLLSVSYRIVSGRTAV